MKRIWVIEWDEANHKYVARVPHLPQIHGEGRTPEDALQAARLVAGRVLKEDP